ncbi:hexosyltransferase [Pycnococcus provasolii]
MRGADGSVAPFMSGAVYGLSIGLAASIIRDVRIHTMSYLLYGTSSDDANMGKWVDYATKRRELVVDHVVEPKLRVGYHPPRSFRRARRRRRG